MEAPGLAGTGSFYSGPTNHRRCWAEAPRAAGTGPAIAGGIAGSGYSGTVAAVAETEASSNCHLEDPNGLAEALVGDPAKDRVGGLAEGSIGCYLDCSLSYSPDLGPVGNLDCSLDCSLGCSPGRYHQMVVRRSFFLRFLET